MHAFKIHPRVEGESQNGKNVAITKWLKRFIEVMTDWWRPLLPRGRLLVMGEQSPPLKFPIDQLQHRRHFKTYQRVQGHELSQRLVTTTDYLPPLGEMPCQERLATTMTALARSRCTAR